MRESETKSRFWNNMRGSFIRRSY